MIVVTPLEDILEKELQAQVFELLHLTGWKRAYHVYDSRRSQHGFPDIVAVRERVVWLELKRERGKCTPAQKTWLRALRDAQAEVYVVRPRNLLVLSHVLMVRGTDSYLQAELRDELDAEL